MKEIVKKGRIAQWVICTGGIAVSITGGLCGYLSGEQIVSVMLAIVSAAFGIEASAKTKEE